MGSYIEPSFVYLLGLGVGHSIAPPVHNYVAETLGCSWRFEARECPSIEDAVTLIRQPTFAGAIVTMPYKTAIMQHLDGLDDLAIHLGACNNIYIGGDGTLRGTNTDWLGIAGCLLDGDALSPASTSKPDRPALIIGAGGASKAALYAITAAVGCKTVYIVNRDDGEVLELAKVVRTNYPELKVVHVQASEQAKGLQSPSYIVGTIPDNEPVSLKEIEVYKTVEVFLSQAETKGVLLDMCYNPRRTRMLKLAQKYGWKQLEGTSIIGHQLREQYRLWCGEEAVKRLPLKGAWEVLRDTAENSFEINFR